MTRNILHSVQDRFWYPGPHKITGTHAGVEHFILCSMYSSKIWSWHLFRTGRVQTDMKSQLNIRQLPLLKKHRKWILCPFLLDSSCAHSFLGAVWCVQFSYGRLWSLFQLRSWKAGHKGRGRMEAGTRRWGCGWGKEIFLPLFSGSNPILCCIVM